MTLAFFTNINPTELVVIAIVAVLIFGRRLPEVAGRAAGHVQRARRALSDLKRESGLDEELRTAREAMREVTHPSILADIPKLPSPSQAVRRIIEDDTPPDSSARSSTPPNDSTGPADNDGDTIQGPPSAGIDDDL